MAQITGKAFDFKLFRRVLQFVKPYKSIFILAFVFTVILAGLGVLRPILIGQAVDKYVVAGDAQGLLMLILLIVGVLLVEAVLQFFETYYANWLGQSVTIDLRSDLYSHVSRFRLKFFDRTPIGTLVTRVISDIETIAEIFSQGLLSIMGDLLKLIVVVAVMFIYNWELTLYSLIPIPFLIIATNIFKNAIKKAFQQVRTQVARLNAFVQEHLTGMAIVQVFNREKVEAKKFRQINAEHRTAHIRSVWAYSIFFPVVEILSAISLATLVWWGVGGVLEGKVSLGDLIVFILFIYMLFRPIRQLADRFNVLQMGMVGSERVFRLLDTEEAIADIGQETTHFSGALSFKNVWFAYNDEDWILRDLSFDIEEGKTLAFVGATGAGKSSVINLVSRFYEFQKGDILFDGTSIRNYPIDFVRSNIAVVLQDVFLFSDTIKNNITLRDPSITMEAIEQAAKAVGAHDFIMKLPGGYDFDVRERGGMLSVGQRQLISFIRAYVFNPKILILDEATSSIDTASEIMIQNAIDKLTESRTSIVIAHRLSTIQKADKIIVLEKGEIVEQGNHEELLAAKGAYKRLFDLQFQEA